jgi:hypothetical protein
MSSQQYVKAKITHYIDKVTNKIPNSLAQTRVRRQVSLVSSLSTIRLRCALALHRLAALAPGRRKSASTALPPASYLIRPGSSTLTDTRSKGLLTGKDGRRWIDNYFKKITNSLRGMSFVQHPVATADRLDAM